MHGRGPSNWSSESPFYIPMTGPAARPRRSLKHDDTFIVLDSHGDIGASAGGPDGLFNADTRYLSRLELVLNDVQPLLLGSNLRDDNSALTIDLTNPDIYRDGRIVLQKDTLHIVRTIFLWRGTAYQRIGLHNHGERAAELRPDAAVRQRLRRSVRGARRKARRAAASAASKLLGPDRRRARAITGSTARSRTTALHFDPRPTRLAGQRRDLSFRLWRRSRPVRCLSRSSCNKPAGSKPVPFFRGLLAHRREMRQSTARRHQHRNLERYLQRGAVPVDGRPQHADDRHAAGTLSLCRHPLVFDDVRPRRADHRAADAVDRPAASRAACCRRLAFYQARTVDPLADAAARKNPA